MNTAFRQQFPALQRLHNGKPLHFLDGPAGTQVPSSVIQAMVNYYENSNANTHGAFVTTQETDDLMVRTREKVSAFLGAEGPHTISFGQNMTTLNFSLSKAIGRFLQPGDEILITALDHEANRAPWLNLQEQGMVIREIKLLPNGRLDYDDLKEKLNERTRLVAIGYASTIFGTVNDIPLVRALTHQYGAWLLIDAVHYAAHFPVDVQQIGCDFLLCSAYKFYGPHVGLLYSRPGLLDRLNPDRLRTAYQKAPYSIETGTLNHAALAGVEAAIDFIADLGEGASLRLQILSAMNRIHQHEIKMATLLYEGLQKIEGVKVVGPPIDDTFRAPTLAITVEGKRPAEICEHLAQQNVCAWDGHFYALRAIEVLGLVAQGGVTRMGVNIYNTAEEIDYTLKVLKQMVTDNH